MLSKRLFAILAAGSISLCSGASPSIKVEGNNSDSFLAYQMPSFSSQRVYFSGSYSVYRHIIFGDSLSDIGNLQLFLKILHQDESPAVFFKPVNSNEHFRKLLWYLNLSVKDAESAEVFIADILLDVLNDLTTIPIIPDDKYYGGPSGHKTYKRFSNGPVWSEWLGQMLLGDQISNEQKYINRAYGGSWASELGDQKIDWTLDIPILKKSLINYIQGKLTPPNLHFLLSAFLSEYPYSNGGEAIIILYGANDYLANDYSKPESKAYQRTHPAIVVDDIHQELTRLADWAAETTDEAPKSFIYIVNLPDISKTPRYYHFSKPVQAEHILKDIKRHNQLLEKMVTRFQDQEKYHGKVEFRYTDLFSMFNGVYDTLPVKNKTDACYPDDMIQTSPMVANARAAAQQPRPVPCKNPDDYFFWDLVHPTRQVHAALSYSLCLELAKDIVSIDCFKPDWKNEQGYPDSALNP